MNSEPFAHVRRCLAALIAAGFLSVSASCNADTAIVPRDAPAPLLVHAILNPSAREQFVIVERVLASGTAVRTCFTTSGGFVSESCVPEARATVLLLTPDQGQLTATEVTAKDPQGRALTTPTGVYRFALDSLGVSLILGGTYHLSVRTSLGEQVLGTTTIPQPAPVTPRTRPPSFNADTDSLRLTWLRAKGASQYQVVVRSPGEQSYQSFGDTALVVAGSLRINTSFGFFPGIRANVAVFAMDSNYYDYSRTSNNLFTGRGLINRLQGAIGVFGSVATVDTLSVEVTGDTSDPRSGRYALVSGEAKPETPTEFLLYFGRQGFVTGVPGAIVSGNYATPSTSGQRTRALFGSTSTTTATLYFSTTHSMTGRFGLLTATWRGSEISGTFTAADSTTQMLVYRKQ